METSPQAHIVVGVVPGQSAAVVKTAATFAHHFGANLVCAFVDASRYAVERYADGTLLTMPLDPDLSDERQEFFDPELEKAIAVALEHHGIPWSTRVLAGGPAVELGRLAEELDARMIVVGTRRPGFRGTIQEFFGGSVAAQLAHRQHRPVVVVPLDPVTGDEALPWAGGAADAQGT